MMQTKHHTFTNEGMVTVEEGVSFHLLKQKGQTCHLHLFIIKNILHKLKLQFEAILSNEVEKNVVKNKLNKTKTEMQLLYVSVVS